MMNLQSIFLKHPRLVWLTAAAFLLPLVIIIISTYGKTAVKIVVAPGDANITINGERAKAGKRYLVPGEYTLRATRSGFSDTEQTFTVGEDETSVAIILEPSSEEGFRIVEGDSKEYLEAEAIIGEKVREEGELFRQQNPIVEFLPYRSLIFDIDYRISEQTNGLVIIISANGAVDRQYALEQISNWGFNPQDFEIEYQNKSN